MNNFFQEKMQSFFRNWERNFINVPTTTTITSRFKITKRKCVIILNNNTMCFSTWTILAKTREKKHKEKRNQTSKIWHNLSINESVQIDIISCLSNYFFNFKCIFIGLETKVIFFNKVHTLHKIQNLKKMCHSTR